MKFFKCFCLKSWIIKKNLASQFAPILFVISGCTVYSSDRPVYDAIYYEPAPIYLDSHYHRHQEANLDHDRETIVINNTATATVEVVTPQTPQPTEPPATSGSRHSASSNLAPSNQTVRTPAHPAPGNNEPSVGKPAQSLNIVPISSNTFQHARPIKAIRTCRSCLKR